MAEDPVHTRYLEVLLSLARGLPDGDTSGALRIMRKLLAPSSGHLLVLYAGAQGRERRARELASLASATQQEDTSMVAFHHVLVQLLSELSAGLANEVRDEIPPWRTVGEPWKSGGAAVEEPWWSRGGALEVSWRTADDAR